MLVYQAVWGSSVCVHLRFQVKAHISVSGNASFCSMIRNGTIDSIGNSAISFMETEYHPRRMANHDILVKDSPLQTGQREGNLKLKRRGQATDTELHDIALGGPRASTSSASVYSERV